MGINNNDEDCDDDGDGDDDDEEVGRRGTAAGLLAN